MLVAMMWSLCDVCVTLQNAQAIIDLNIAVQERDKSIATKDARYLSVCVCQCTTERSIRPVQNG